MKPMEIVLSFILGFHFETFMYIQFALITFSIVIAYTATAQNISSHLPSKIIPNQNYLFYFHGAVVSVKGDNAINDGAPEWGRYEYSNILDSLQKRNFYVVSEIRKQGVDDSIYEEKIVKQIDTLLKQGIKPSQILLIGASSGWNIVLRAAAKLKKRFVAFCHYGRMLAQHVQGIFGYRIVWSLPITYRGVRSTWYLHSHFPPKNNNDFFPGDKAAIRTQPWFHL